MTYDVSHALLLPAVGKATKPYNPQGFTPGGGVSPSALLSQYELHHHTPKQVHRDKQQLLDTMTAKPSINITNVCTVKGVTLPRQETFTHLQVLAQGEDVHPAIFQVKHCVNDFVLRLPKAQHNAGFCVHAARLGSSQHCQCLEVTCPGVTHLTTAGLSGCMVHMTS